MDIQNNIRRVSTSSIVLFVALLSAIALALVAWQALATQTASSGGNGQTTFHLAIGGEQVGHDRSEQGFGSRSAGGEQIAHNRSEEGFTQS